MPHLPRETKVDAAKCHACHAKCRGVTGDQNGPKHATRAHAKCRGVTGDRNGPKSATRASPMPQVSRRQEAKPSGKTSELSQGRSQKHQERHQSYAKTKEADIKSSKKNTSIKASKSSPKVFLSHCSRVDVKRRMRNTNIKSSKSSPKVLLSHCSRVDVKRRIRNTNIKSSKSCHAVLCHTEKTHLQPQTTQCLTTFDPGPCDRSALFARPVAQAWPPPSLWMASTLRRFSSVNQVQPADLDGVEPPVAQPPAAQVAMC